RGDDLEQLGADRHQRVVQSEALDAGVVEGDLDAEGVDELLGGDEVVAGHEGDLAQSEHGHLPLKFGVRFSTKARKASPQSSEAMIVPWSFVSRAMNSPKSIDSCAASC